MFIELLLCKKCHSIISLELLKNIKKDEFDKLLDIKEDSENCEFCFNSLNNNYSNLISKIGEKIKEYEYLNINIQNRFSCLFSIFYIVLINKLLKKNKISKKIFDEIIKTSQIRKDKEENNNKLEIIMPEDDNSKIKYYLDFLNKDINSNFIEKINKAFSPEILCKNFYLDFKITIAPFYIYGNYIKLDREIGQNPFIKDGIKVSLSSINEELQNFLKNIFLNRENELVFSAGGREDRDVRMLGHGRAFIYAVYNAKKHYSLDFNSINKEMNNTLKRVKVNGLRICDKKNFHLLKKAESEKIKIYTAIVWSKEIITKEICDKIEKVEDLLINQITPLRVLHKRVLKVREKYIYEIKIKEIINPHFMIIEIKSSAGTYIKEFVNGDIGRTYPSLGDIIGNECDIIQLDVQDIII